MRSANARPVVALATVVLLSSSGCGDQNAADEVPVSSSTPVSMAAPLDSRPLDLTGVPEASVPMVIAERLANVSAAVGADVGRDVFAGGRFDDAATADVTLTLFGTDAGVIDRSLDRHAGDVRDRVSVVETQYAAIEIERFAAEAQRRLDAAGIEGSAGVRWGLDAVDLTLYHADGQADPVLEARADDAIGDIPVVVTFSRPPTPAG